jgi:ATP-dependent Lon protease
VRYTEGVEAPHVEQNLHTRQVSPADETQPDTSRYRLTIEEASQLFAAAGVPRSARTITRFCQLGDLDCLRVETEKNFKWLVDEASAEKRIEALKQAITFSKKHYQDMSSHVETINETQPDMSRHDDHVQSVAEIDTEKEYLRTQVNELEDEIMHLRIEKSAKDQVITQMANERKEFISQMNDISFKLGEATTKLQMLEAPRPETEARHVQTDGETGAGQGGPRTQPEPEPAKTGPEKRGIFGRLFG